VVVSEHSLKLKLELEVKAVTLKLEAKLVTEVKLAMMVEPELVLMDQSQGPETVDLEAELMLDVETEGELEDMLVAKLEEILEMEVEAKMKMELVIYATRPHPKVKAD
jgi:hypothetical protein